MTKLILLIIVCLLSYTKVFAQSKSELSDQTYRDKAEARQEFLRKLSKIPSDSAFKLEMDFLAFRVFPDISRFTHITSISAMGNQLQSIHLNRKNIRYLTYLDVRDNPLTTLKIGRAPRLKSIKLSGTKLNSIPNSLRKARKLESIELIGLKIDKLPYWLKHRKQLKELLFRYHIPELNRKNIRRMRQVHILQLASAPIDSLPDYFVKLKKLERLTIAYCNLHDLPENFYKLEKLKVLILYSDSFSQIPAVCYDLPNLHHLDFYYNRLIDIPPGISKLNHIEELYLSYNRLSVLPAEMARLNTLKKLYLHDNNLEKAPDWLNQLTELQILDMGFNNIDTLPDFQNLVKLDEVDFRGNQLHSFPFQLLELPNTKLVFLGGNPFEYNEEQAKRLAKLSKEFAGRGGRLVMLKP